MWSNFFETQILLFFFHTNEKKLINHDLITTNKNITQLFLKTIMQSLVQPLHKKKNKCLLLLNVKSR